MANVEDNAFTSLAALVANDPKYNRTVWDMISEYGRALLGSIGLFQNTRDRAMDIVTSPQSVASGQAMTTLLSTQNVLRGGGAANDNESLSNTSERPANLTNGALEQNSTPLKRAA